MRPNADPPRIAALVRDAADPRVDPASLRWIPASETTQAVLLIGVVHDHPSSIERVTAVIPRVNPGVLALEVPPITIPYYALLATTLPPGSPRGGELTAALRHAPAARVIGIDLPSRWGPRVLARYLRTESPSRGTLQELARKVASVTKHALGVRLTALKLTYSTATLHTDTTPAYEASLDDSPITQARDEAQAVQRSDRFFAAVDTPPGLAAYDSLREDHMVHRLDQARRSDRVVAVIGRAHLDAVATALRAE